MTTTHDMRQTAPWPKRAPKDMELVTREEAAELSGTTPRTITRWASKGTITKYLSPRGTRVMFSRAQAEELYEDPVQRERDHVEAGQREQERTRRW